MDFEDQYGMDFDNERVRLVEYRRDRSVKQQFLLPWTEVPGLMQSLSAAAVHIQGHPDHGQEGHEH
jgi:hypothetical protein